MAELEFEAQSVSRAEFFPLAWDNWNVKELGILLKKNTRLKRQNIDKKDENEDHRMLPTISCPAPQGRWLAFSLDRKTR